MSQFRNLVFEGGGVKGIAYAGAIKVLEEKGILPDIRRVGGTSAGAITATLLSLGADNKDVRDIVGNTSFVKFMDDSWGLVRDAKRLVDDYGWYKGDSFSKWMKKQIHAFTGKPDLTFGELRERAVANPDHFNDLYVISTNLSLQMAQVYSWETHPDMPLWEAVRRSMSIPLFFACVREQEEIHVDGGVTWNYPVDLFDDMQYLQGETPSAFETPQYPTRYDEQHVYNKQTLGFRVDTRDEIAAEKRQLRMPPLDIDNFVDYAKALIGYMTDMANKAHLHDNDWHRTVYIDASGVRATDFNLAPESINTLVNNGEAGARDYFSWFENPDNQPANRSRSVETNW